MRESSVLLKGRRGGGGWLRSENNEKLTNIREKEKESAGIPVSKKNLIQSLSKDQGMRRPLGREKGGGVVDTLCEEEKKRDYFGHGKKFLCQDGGGTREDKKWRENNFIQRRGVLTNP